jgi:hypothetical protein
MSATDLDPQSGVDELAAQYDARTLAAALCARLAAEKLPELAKEIESVLVRAGFIDPNPADPH